MGLLNRKQSKKQNDDFATAIDRFFLSNDFDHPRLQLVCRNRNREVYLIKEQGQVYYVKRFFATSSMEKVKNMVLNKAINSLRLSNRLMLTGFLVAEPVLALQCRKNGESFYVTKKFTGISLNNFLSGDIPEALKGKALNQFVITIANLFKNGFLHCDPTLSNFLIREKNNRYEVGLIDLDAIIHLPRPINTLTYKNLAKLYTRSPILWEYQNGQQGLNYLADFIQIYNHKLNPFKVRKRISQMVDKRVNRFAS